MFFKDFYPLFIDKVADQDIVVLKHQFLDRINEIEAVHEKILSVLTLDDSMMKKLMNKLSDLVVTNVDDTDPSVILE